MTHFAKSALTVFILGSCTLMLSACVSPAKKNAAITHERNRRVLAQKKVTEMEQQVQALKEENSLLATALERKDLVEPKLPAEYQKEMSARDPQQQNEALLYQKIVESYKAQDEKGLEAFEALLLKAFPKSIYKDDVGYYKALIAYHAGRSTEALEKLDLVLQQYPQTRRWRDIQVAKAMIYRKLNLLDQERQVLAKLQMGPKVQTLQAKPILATARSFPITGLRTHVELLPPPTPSAQQLRTQAKAEKLQVTPIESASE